MYNRFLAAALLAATITGCQSEEWQTKDISGVMPDLAFSLTGEQGTPVTEKAFAGNATLLFFGFTSCPDVCPTTLARLSTVLDKLPEEERRQVRVLFVSVDPERDDPEHLRKYTEYYGPEFVGLTGTQDELRALTKRYRVTYSYAEPDENGDYAVSHSSAVFGFAPDGRIRVLMRDDDGTEAILADLRRLVNERG